MLMIGSILWLSEIKIFLAFFVLAVLLLAPYYSQIHQSKNIINGQQTNTLFILFNGVVNSSTVPNKIVKLSLPIVLSGFG